MTDQTYPLSIPGTPLRHPLLWVILALWAGGVLAMASAGVFRMQWQGLPIPLAMAALTPPLIYLFAYRTFAGLRAWVAQLDLAWVVGTQTWRVVGIVFVMFWGINELPVIFALTAGLGDIAVGVFALATTLAVSRRISGWESRVRMLVYVGMADFVAAFATGILSGQGFPLLLAGDPLPGQIQGLPLSMIPTFGVPLFMILHIIAWQKLHAER